MNHGLAIHPHICWTEHQAWQSDSRKMVELIYRIFSFRRTLGMHCTLSHRPDTAPFHHLWDGLLQMEQHERVTVATANRLSKLGNRLADKDPLNWPMHSLLFDPHQTIEHTLHWHWMSYWESFHIALATIDLTQIVFAFPAAQINDLKFIETFNRCKGS